MKTNKKRYKIVVLSDLSKSSGTILKSTVGLAQMVDGDIELFHVKKPTDIVDSENQLSAMRTIHSKQRTTDKEIQSLIGPISKEYGMTIPYSFAFGNVKNEIDDFIKESQPDIIVLGKRKLRPFRLIGDGITEYILKIYDGVVLINTDKDVIAPNKEISLGSLNSANPFLELEFAEDLIKHSRMPLKSFKITKNASSAKKTPTAKDLETIDYVFEHNDSSIKNLSNYLLKNNISILSIDRARKDQDKGQKLSMPDIHSVIGRLDTNLLISGK